MMVSTISPETLNHDEVLMAQGLLFSDGLMDLKNLRTQLYSAADYFELSYSNNDQKQIVVDTLKDYAIKAIVNAVDHLGSVTYRVNDFVDEKVDEVSQTEFRVSCIEQRLRTCQDYIDHEGLSQQSSVMNTPKYHKRYILPEDSISGVTHTKSKYFDCDLDDRESWLQFKSAVRATIREAPMTPVRKGRSPSPSLRVPQQSATFSVAATTPRKELENRAVSPRRFPLLRSGSVLSRPTTPTSRPTTPSSNAGMRYPSEPRRTVSMRLPAEKSNSKDIQQHPSKSKRLFKALLSRRKPKGDDMLYTYLDEY